MDADVLVDEGRTFRAVTAGDEAPAVAHIRFLEIHLAVARCETFRLRQYPDLEEVDGLFLRAVHLRVADARARAHHLRLQGPDDALAAQRILVLQRALQHPGED